MYGSNLSRQLLSNLKILSRDSEVGIFLPLTIGLPRAIFMVVRACPLSLSVAVKKGSILAVERGPAGWLRCGLSVARTVG